MTQSLDEMVEESVLLRCRINGASCEEIVSPTISLLDFLRDQRGLTGTHMGCMTGHCGACTVMMDGRVAKSCLAMASTCSGRSIVTIEGLGSADGTLSVVQQAFRDANSFQCGFCAPGMILVTVELLKANPDPSAQEVGDALAGNLCRCTGYRSILKGVSSAAERLRGSTSVVQ